MALAILLWTGFQNCEPLVRVGSSWCAVARLLVAPLTLLVSGFAFSNYLFFLLALPKRKNQRNSLAPTPSLFLVQVLVIRSLTCCGQVLVVGCGRRPRRATFLARMKCGVSGGWWWETAVCQLVAVRKK